MCQVLKFGYSPHYVDLFPAAFAACTILTSYNTTNVVVFAEYVLYAHGIDTPSRWQIRGIGIGLVCLLSPSWISSWTWVQYTLLAFIIIISTKWSIRLGNVLGSIKSILLILYVQYLCWQFVDWLIPFPSIIITGFVVLGGHTKVADPHAAFRNPMNGTVKGGNGLATAIISIIFSFGGS